MFRLDRIQQVGEQFSTCGDYLQGIVRIRSTNPECGHDYFRPFSCKGFYLCPSCSLVVRYANCSALHPGQKRTLLFAEHLTNEVLLNLPHLDANCLRQSAGCQFVFTLPKALRPYFRHDRRLFADVSRLIYSIINEFYAEAAGRALDTATIVAHLRFLRSKIPCANPI